MEKVQDDIFRDALVQGRVIAIVGFSANPKRPSNGVARYLQSQGYRIVPINPGLAGQEILGEAVFGSVSEIPPDLSVDMIDIFRPSGTVDGIVEAAIQHLPALRTVWTQLGIVSPAARARAQAANLVYVEDRCSKIEHARLFA